MCIIISKEKTARLPKEEELKQSFTHNSDGAGFMYVDNGQVVIDKGYMDYETFIRHYRKLLKRFNNFKNKSLIIHCRIGTSGGNTKANTHPYPITSNESLLHSTRVISDIGIAHNGIISGYGEPKGLNDTQEFIIKYITPLYENYKNFYKNSEIMKGIQKITGSKLAILDKDDNIYYVGDFVEDDGLKCSNTTYKSYTYTYSNSYSKTYSSPYTEQSKFSLKDYDYDDEYDLDKYLDKYDDYDDLDKYDSGMTPLADDYYVDIKGTGNYEKVGNRKLWFDWNSYYLYEEFKDGELEFLSDCPIIYDSKYCEIN